MRTDVESRAVGKAVRRVVPLLALLYFVSFLDRVNVGFASLTMNADIGLSDSGFGLGAGIFFAGYIAFAVPANFLLRRFGASRWIAAIAIVWGCVSLCMAFVRTPLEFYVVRCCLGVAESGFFPGVILYLTTWFPRHVQGRVVANLFVALPLSSVFGAPLSGALLQTQAWGLRGWQIMFLVEALPAILLGLAALRFLPDTPEHASWLTADERRALDAAAGETAAEAQMGGARGLLDARVWGLGLVYFLIVVALYGLAFWAPQVFKASAAFTPRQIGLLTAIPYLGATLAVVLWSRRSDRRGERVWHLVLPCVLAAMGLALAGLNHDVTAITIGLLLATSGIYAACVVFWTLPGFFLSGAAAAGIALINSMGNVAGGLGPYLVGWLKTGTGGYVAGILTMAASMGAAALVALVVGLRIRRDAGAAGRISPGG